MDKAERLALLEQYNIEDKDILVLTKHEYDIADAETKHKKIVLNIDNEDYLKLLNDKFSTANSKVYARIQKHKELGYPQFFNFIGIGQSGKSIGNLNLLFWTNNTIEYKTYNTFSLTEFLYRIKTYKKSYISLEEAERVLRSFEYSKEREVSNVILDFYDTIPYLQNILSITQPSMRLLTRLKPKLDFVFNFVQRGIANVYSVVSNIHNERIYFHNTKERFYSIPIPIQIYADYERDSYTTKQKLLTEDIKKIETYIKEMQSVSSNPYI